MRPTVIADDRRRDRPGVHGCMAQSREAAKGCRREMGAIVIGRLRLQGALLIGSKSELGTIS
jgi:hypothetical protein